MTSSPPFPAALTAAAHVERVLRPLVAAASDPATVLPGAALPGGALPGAAAPEAALVARVIDTAFWASLRREEGASPTISLAFLPAALAGEPLTFRRRLRLSAVALARLAPAVKRPGIHLGVAAHRGVPALWGTTRRIPPFTLVLEVVEPGLLVLKHRQPGERAKFANLVVLEGDRAKIIDLTSTAVGAAPATDAAGCPPPLAAHLGLGVLGELWGAVADRLAPLLLELATSMRAHGHGGSLLLVPDESTTWPLSIARANPYVVTPPYRALALPPLAATPAGSAGLDALRPTIDAIAGLTAVDGATVLRGGCEVVAFGATIVRRHGSPQVRRALLTEPIAGQAPTLVPLAQLGGTRHRSAAQFVHDQRDAIALVASQDGRFTVFAWSRAADAVAAHRIESLLL